MTPSTRNTAHSRPASSESPRAEALRARLARPSIVAVDDAGAYWLEDPAGRRASPESPSSADALAAAFAAFDAGRPTDGLLLVCRLVDGERYEIGGGAELIDAALAAAGRPRMPRSVRGGPASG